MVRPSLGVLLAISLALSGAATLAAFDDPVARNAGVTAEYDQAYAPFTDADGPPEDTVVFLPEPYGPWLNHPFQALRNDPDFDQATIYALQENEFEVVDAYPDRRFVRYTYRGTWNPFDGSTVTPHLQEVSTVRGETVTVDASFDLPDGVTSTSFSLRSAEGHAFYSALASGRAQDISLHVNGSSAWVTGAGVEPTGDGTLPVGDRGTLTLIVNVNTEGTGFTYRLVLPIAMGQDGERRAMTPELEVCTTPQLCGGEAAYIPGESGSPFEIDVTLRAD